MIDANRGVRAPRAGSCARGSLAFALRLVVLLACAPALAQDAAQPVLGTAASGLRGLVHTGLPLPSPELNLSAAAGYGFTEPFSPVPGAHHRAQGSLGLALAPLSWLAFALRLDGRLELHPDDGDGAHSAGFGDPRLLARAGHALSRALSLGVEVALWFPGHEAPSFEPSATSADARALLAFTPDGPWVVLGALGFRLDNSASSAPDLTRLRLGDRISLGLSDSNAALVAAGAARRFGAQVELFGELSADLLLGSRAPAAHESPLRAALGGRYFPSRALQAELTAIGSLSQRPDVVADDPLVPIEPRLLLLAAVRYSTGFGATPRAEIAREALAPTRTTEPPAPRSALVAGSLVDDRGDPLPEATLTLRTQDGAMRETITDAAGRYEFTDVPPGPAALEAAAIGFAPQRWTVDAQPGMAPAPARALAPSTEVGMLRGLVRSFDSTPLRARILVHDARGRSRATSESGDEGHFEIELAPGRYRVTISAPGYRTHRRDVQVDANGVAILNVDMREQP
jgi:hypothetical protein